MCLFPLKTASHASIPSQDSKPRVYSLSRQQATRLFSLKTASHASIPSQDSKPRVYSLSRQQATRLFPLKTASHASIPSQDSKPRVYSLSRQQATRLFPLKTASHASIPSQDSKPCVYSLSRQQAMRLFISQGTFLCRGTAGVCSWQSIIYYLTLPSLGSKKTRCLLTNYSYSSERTLRETNYSSTVLSFFNIALLNTGIVELLR